MAVSHAFPIRGQAERVRFQFFVASTDAPFAGALTDLAATVSKDDGTTVASTNALNQVGTSSVAYLDLTATEMDANAIFVAVAASNAVAGGVEIVPLDLTVQTDRYDQLADIRIENLWVDNHDYLWNRVVRDGAAIAVYNSLGFLKGQGTIVEGNASADKGKIQ